jgi:mannose-6-phosphate isomerase-like protein (cupin superfamily)
VPGARRFLRHGPFVALPNGAVKPDDAAMTDTDGTNTDVTNIDAVLDTIDQLWTPHVLAAVNDWAVKVAKVRGDHVWHAHDDTDEVFIVLSGALTIRRRGAAGEEVVHLGPHDVHVVPRGVEHRPSAPDGAVLMLVDPADTLSTGDFVGELPAHISSTTGVEVAVPGA